MNDGKVYSCQQIFEQYTRKQIIEKCKSTKFVDKHFFRTYVVEPSKNQLQPSPFATYFKRQTAIVPTSASLTYVKQWNLWTTLVCRKPFWISEMYNFVIWWQYNNKYGELICMALPKESYEWHWVEIRNFLMMAVQISHLIWVCEHISPKRVSKELQVTVGSYLLLLLRCVLLLTVRRAVIYFIRLFLNL